MTRRTPRAGDPGEAGTALVEAVRAALARQADPERAAGQQAYMKSAMPYRGLTTPTLRATLKPLFADPDHRLTTRDQWEATVRLLWDGAEFREERYAGIELTGHRTSRAWQDGDAVPLYEHLLTTGAWWDLVDPVASDRIGPILRRDPDVEGLRMREWACGPSLWLRRTAIISQLKFGADTDTALLRDCIEPNLMPIAGRPHEDDDTHFAMEFFIRKAIGWALRQYARTDPDWVRAFVAEHERQLSGLSRREALKHL